MNDHVTADGQVRVKDEWLAMELQDRIESAVRAELPDVVEDEVLHIDHISVLPSEVVVEYAVLTPDESAEVGERDETDA